MLLELLGGGEDGAVQRDARSCAAGELRDVVGDANGRRRPVLEKVLVNGEEIVLRGALGALRGAEALDEGARLEGSKDGVLADRREKGHRYSSQLGEEGVHYRDQCSLLAVRLKWGKRFWN